MDGRFGGREVFCKVEGFAPAYQYPADGPTVDPGHHVGWDSWEQRLLSGALYL